MREFGDAMGGTLFTFHVDDAGRVTQAIRGEEARPAFDRARADGTRFLFFDPFDRPEYCYMAWRGLTQPVLARLVAPHVRASHHPLIAQIPADWSVML